MARVLIEAVGSAGDVHPFVGLGAALVARGHDVTLFANEVFADGVTAAGVPFESSGPAAWSDESTRDPDLWHPQRGPLRILGGVVEQLLQPMTARLLDLVRGRASETVLVGSTLGFAAHCVAEATGARYVCTHLAPSVLRSEFRTPRLPGLWTPDGAPRWWKRLVFRLADAVVDRAVCPRLNAVRADLGLRPVRRVFDSWLLGGDLRLMLFPEWFAPPQPDWPSCTFAGFPLYDEGGTRAVDSELDAWLDAGDPPIVFTHGSANHQSHRFFRVAAEAARKLGRRALLVTAEPSAVGGLGADLHHAAYVPFSRVAPRAAVFVGHGGIGTTAQALAARVPQLVVPMGFDQFDNGSRVEDLGCGAMVPVSRWTVPAAVRTLSRLLDDPAVATRATEIGDRLRGVDARSVAAAAIEGVLHTGEPG